jgi:predicted patatin/cPLA2 family phospholipase
MNNIGLVLEGGGMRGVFSSGVMEYFLENNLFFPYIIGVSAGACNASSYLSRQRGRNEQVNIKFADDPRYLSLRNLLFHGNLFGMNFIFHEIPEKLIPFDFDTFLNIKEKFIIVATDCETGKPVYFNNSTTKEEYIEILKASSSLPYVSPFIKYNGRILLDGAISDSIPIQKSIEDGNSRNIVILTRNKGYRKQPLRLSRLASLKYRKYPNLIKALENRYKIYNNTMDFIEKLEEKGEILVIRPVQPLLVGRVEKDKNKLYELFKHGYEEGKRNYNKILDFSL